MGSAVIQVMGGEGRAGRGGRAEEAETAEQQGYLPRISIQAQILQAFGKYLTQAISLTFCNIPGYLQTE